MANEGGGDNGFSVVEAVASARVVAYIEVERALIDTDPQLEADLTANLRLMTDD